MIRKISIGLLSFTLVLGLFSFDASTQQASAQQVNPLCFTFSFDFGRESRGNHVLKLQNFLSVTETGYFGEQTQAAVVRFQAQHGIEQTGYVGPLTRARLNSLYGCNSTPQTPTTPTVSTTQTYPTITSFVVSPTYIGQGQTMAWSGSAVKGSANIKQYRAYVVGSSGGAWTPAPRGDAISFSSPAVQTLQNASSFYNGAGTYTVRFEVEDISGGKAWQDRTVIIFPPVSAPAIRTAPTSMNDGRSNLGSVLVSLEDVLRLINAMR